MPFITGSAGHFYSCSHALDKEQTKALNKTSARIENEQLLIQRIIEEDKHNDKLDVSKSSSSPELRVAASASLAENAKGAKLHAMSTMPNLPTAGFSDQDDSNSRTGNKPTIQKNDARHKMALQTSSKSVVGAFSQNSKVSRVAPSQMTHEDPRIHLQRQLRKEQFNIVMSCIIVVNAIVIALEADLKPEPDQASTEDTVVWVVLESMFCIVFIAEILINVFWNGLIWFRSAAAMFDTFLVVCMILDTWVLPLLKSTLKSFGMLSILRLLRLVRLVRLMRIMTMCRRFNAVAQSFVTALRSMIWICLMMIIGIFLTAIFTTTFIGKSETFREMDLGGWTGYDRFGTTFRSMYSLFELMTLEDWPAVGRPLISKQPLMFFFLFLFIMIFTFGLLNMIVAMVVESTISEKKKMDDAMNEEKKWDTERQLRRVKEAFESADRDGDGILTREEFTESLENSEFVHEILGNMDVTPELAEQLFDTLDADYSGSLRVEEFMMGLAELGNSGGKAENWHLLATHAGIHQIQRQMQLESKEDIIIKRLDLQATVLSKIVDRLDSQSERLDALAAAQNKLRQQCLASVSQTAVPGDAR